MQNSIITAVGIFAILAGLSNSVQARPIESVSQVEDINLSSSSALEFEDRTVADDYGKFFSNTTDINTIPLSEIQSDPSVSEIFGNRQDATDFRVNSQVNLLLSEPLPPVNAAIPYRANQSFFEGNDGFKVETELNN